MLDEQFSRIVEINCRALEHANERELIVLVIEALRLTQPDFGFVPIDTLLLSQNEGRLLFAHLQLREKLEGSLAVAEEYRELMRYFKHKRYESRERVYLFPYVACRVIENDFREGNFEAALAVCDDALAELTREKRLFAYDRLLEWKQKILDAIGFPDDTPGRLLEQLRLILKRAPERVELLVPCEEQGHVYCLNQVIRDRRNLLGFSQEKLSDAACSTRNVSRIENEERKLQRRSRKLLLQKVNMSGERYDYEIVSEKYEDYLLRSELDRAILYGKWEEAEKLLLTLKQRVPDIPANRQHIMKKEIEVRGILPKENPNRISLAEKEELLCDVIQLTLPLNMHEIGTWPVGILTINEVLSLIAYAMCLKKQRKYEASLPVLMYIKQCIENAGVEGACYEELYTRVVTNIANVNDELNVSSDASELSYCLQVSLKSYNSYRSAENLYGIAHNLRARIPENSVQEQANMKKEVVSLLKQAYAAAIVSDDAVGKKRISECYRIETGMELDF